MCFLFYTYIEMQHECVVLKVFLIDLVLKYLERFINSPTKNSDTHAQDCLLG